MVSRAHLLSLGGAYIRPITRIVSLSLTVRISQTCVSPRRPLRTQSCRDARQHRPIHPEDEILASEGEHLVYRSYPEFTAKRLNMAKAAIKSLIESWTSAYRRPPFANDLLTNWRYLLIQKPDEGLHETVMF